MRRLTFFLLFLSVFFTIQNAGALTKTDFDSVVDFSVTLRKLSYALKADTSVKINPEKFIVAYGTVTSVSFLNRKKDTYKVRLELVSGEWIGLEDVKSYRVYVDFEGPDYYSIIPARRPRTIGSKVVVKDSRVLIVAKIVKPIEIPLSGKYWLLKGVYIRKIY